MASDMAERFRQETLPPAYDRFLVPKIFEPWARRLIDFVDLQPGEAVLDVATGPGTVARVAAQRVGTTGRVTGVDISQPMLKVARSKPQSEGMAPIEYVESPATELRVPNDAFDVALCQQGLQFFPDRQCALTEIRRALKPGGRLGVAVWGAPSPNFAGVGDALRECGYEIPEQSPFGRDASDLPSALSAAGFEIMRAEDVTLSVTYEGGVDEVIQHAAAGPNGPTVAVLTSEKRAEFRRRLEEKLQPWSDGDVIRTPMMARVAMGLKST